MVSRTSRFVSIAPLISLAITFPTARFSAGSLHNAARANSATLPILIGWERKKAEVAFAAAATRFLENLNDVETIGGSSRRSVSALSRYGRIVERAPR